MGESKLGGGDGSGGGYQHVYVAAVKREAGGRPWAGTSEGFWANGAA